MLVYVGACGLFGFSGYQIHKDKPESAIATFMTGLGILGVGSQNQLQQRYLTDIRNDPRLPGSPVNPGGFDPSSYRPSTTYKPGSDNNGPPPPPHNP